MESELENIAIRLSKMEDKLGKLVEAQTKMVENTSRIENFLKILTGSHDKYSKAVGLPQVCKILEDISKNR